MNNSAQTESTNIRVLLDAAGVSYADVCRDIGYSYRTLYQAAQGVSRPSLDLAIALADYFAVPLDFLVGRHDRETADAILKDFPKHFHEVRRCAYEEYLHAHKDAAFLHIGGYTHPYPYSLAEEITGKPIESVLTQDQLDGMEEALSKLPERTRNMILRYYRDLVTLDDLVKEYGVTRERVRQIIVKGCRTLRYPALRNLVVYGKAGSRQKSELEQLHRDLTEKQKSLSEWSESLDKLKAELDKRSDIPAPLKKDAELWTMPLEAMYLSARSYNALCRHEVSTLGQVVALVKQDRLIGIRNLGRKSYEEITKKIKAITGMSYEDLPW